MGAYEWGKAKPLPRIAAVTAVAAEDPYLKELDAIKAQRIQTLAELRTQELQARARLSHIQTATKRALAKQEVIVRINTTPFPTIVFTDPPGTGAKRMRELLAEIDDHQFTSPRLDRRKAA